VRHGGAGSCADDREGQAGLAGSGGSTGGNGFPCRKLGHRSASPGEIPTQEFVFSLEGSVSSQARRLLSFVI